ncbi:MAG: hypothetical protein ACRERD_23185 [Candidatus Binatia bacterium]
MDLNLDSDDLLTSYLMPFLKLTGERRTATLPRAVRGIIASGSRMSA